MIGRFYVYRNLNKGGFSIMQKGKVLKVVDFLIMKNVELRVRKGGNARAKKELSRNVHAFAVGEIVTTDELIGNLLNTFKYSSVVYNPFKNKTFVDYWTGEPVLHTDVAIFKSGKLYVPKTNA